MRRLGTYPTLDPVVDESTILALTRQLQGYIENLDNWLTINLLDLGLNEIKMIDIASGVYSNLNRVVKLPDLASHLGFHVCIFDDAVGCADPDRTRTTPLGDVKATTTDIFLNHGKLAMPAPQVPTSVVFNTCGTGDAEFNKAYETLVHEAGHALGVHGGQNLTGKDQEAGHPIIADSVMNYDKVVGVVEDDEPDCSPHPFDILAIYALYQTR